MHDNSFADDVDNVIAGLTGITDGIKESYECIVYIIDVYKGIRAERYHPDEWGVAVRFLKSQLKSIGFNARFTFHMASLIPVHLIVNFFALDREICYKYSRFISWLTCHETLNQTPVKCQSCHRQTIEGLMVTSPDGDSMCHQCAIIFAETKIRQNK